MGGSSMVISRRAHKALSLIALALVLTLLIEVSVAAAGHRASRQSGAASSGASVAQSYHDPYDGGYHPAFGQLLWRETYQIRAACIHILPTQRLPLNMLDIYATSDMNGRHLGGQLVARLIAVKLGAIATC